MIDKDIVLAGFAPFDGRIRNRSWEVVRRLGDRYGVRSVQLPVEFVKLRQLVPGLASSASRAVLLLGEAPFDSVTVEQVALNIAHSDAPDNARYKPQAEPLVPDGPLALRASWDAVALARRLSEAGVPATPSFHAGTYACNAAFYLALHALSIRTRVGLLHVPYRRWPFGMSLALLARAAEESARALVEELPAATPVARVVP